jgi:predicted AlkP superfamily pyrophosphatase or phosphodiesterase
MIRALANFRIAFLLALPTLTSIALATAAPAPLHGQQAGGAARPAAPALVVLVTVDQLRGDYIDRFLPNLQGGLLRFRDEGVYFPRGEQDHANTSTAPGHSTLLSGRVPARTGILSNELGVPDPAHPLIGGATGEGASPHRFRGTTLYDWMLMADGGTRALSVGRKDRGAILPLGSARAHVYWWDSGRFTTSTYYRGELPDFVKEWNARIDPAEWEDREWTLMLPASAYPEPDEQPWEGVGSNRANVFPHVMRGIEEMERFPWADSLTLDLALRGVRELGLGQRAGGTDLLSIALGTVDVVGHHFGPESRELHDMVLRVDRWLGHFMAELEAMVPAVRILYVLTSDHGVQPMPEHLHAAGDHDAGRVSTARLLRPAIEPLQQRFQHSLGASVHNGVLIADTAAMRARGINVPALSRELKQMLESVPGIQQAWTPETLDAAPDSDPVARLFRRAIPPSYGWLVAAQVRENWVMTSSIQATHGSWTAADRSVPIAFLGAGIRPQRVERMVPTVDIAPTLARLLGVRPSEVLDGVPIPEVLGDATQRR